MNEPHKAPIENMVQCPACSHRSESRGAKLLINWFECAYCYGTGSVTEKRYNAWQERSPKFSASGS